MADHHPPYLRLVSSAGRRALARTELLRRLSDQEFNSGSWQQALERKDYFLHHSLEIHGVPTDDVDEKECRATEAILAVLKQETGLRAERIDRALLKRVTDHVSINLGLIELVETSGDGQTPMEKVEKYMLELADHLWRSGVVITLEGLDADLWELGVHVHNSDLTRLLLWGINSQRLVPLVFVLPNIYKRYNPLLVIIKGDLAVPTNQTRVLRAFAW